MSSNLYKRKDTLSSQRRKHKVLSNNGLGGIDDEDEYDDESLSVSMSNRDYHVDKVSVEDAKDDEGNDGGSAEKFELKEPVILKSKTDKDAI